MARKELEGLWCLYLSRGEGVGCGVCAILALGVWLSELELSRSAPLLASSWRFMMANWFGLFALSAPSATATLSARPAALATNFSGCERQRQFQPCFVPGRLPQPCAELHSHQLLPAESTSRPRRPHSIPSPITTLASSLPPLQAPHPLPVRPQLPL